MANYDFGSLSPDDFERLVRDLLAAEHGWRVESFGHGRDGGIDLRTESSDGMVIIQCKHYHGSTFAQLKAAVKTEKKNVEKISPARYMLATSQSLTVTQKDALLNELKGVPIVAADILHRDDINLLLEKHHRVESSHFKLWLASSSNLQRIVNSGLWNRSEALIEDIQSRVRLYVSNPSYPRARELLTQRHVCVIKGSPGVGKSLLAEMLLLNHWHEGWQIIQVRENISEAWTAWTPSERQVFYYDDFLGQTNVGEALGKNEASDIVKFAERVQQSHEKRFIMTTRTQVLHQAEILHEPLLRGKSELVRCAVNLTDYSREARARILYNHLYFSSLDRKVLALFARSKRYERIVNHESFNPRVIQQVVKRDIDSDQDLENAILAALNRPIDIWGPSFSHGLSQIAREVLLQFVSHYQSGVRTQTLREGMTTSCREPEFKEAMQVLEGTWIKSNQYSWAPGDLIWTILDPSCRDYLLAYLADNPSEYLSLFNDVKTLRQAQLLLGYSDARVQGRPEYPDILQAVQTHASSVAASIKDKYVKSPGNRPGDHMDFVAWLTERDVPLRLGLSEWLLDAALANIRGSDQSDAGAGFSSYVIVAEQVIAELQKNRPDQLKVRSRFHELLGHMAMAISDSHDFQAFTSLVYDSGLSGECGSQIAEAEEQLGLCLVNELEQIPSNFDSEEDAKQAVEEIEEIARECGVEPEIANAVETAYQKIDEKIGGWEPSEQYLREYLHRDPIYRDGVGEHASASAPRAREVNTPTDPIGSLFVQLDVYDVGLEE